MSTIQTPNTPGRLPEPDQGVLNTELVNVAVHELLQFWLLHNDTIPIRTGWLRRSGGVWVEYGDRRSDLHLALNVYPQTLYLLEIEIPAEQRGHGYGAALYELTLALAAELGCKEVRQTPSGWTHGGDTRESYLMRRGWRIDSNGEAVMEVSDV